MIAKRTVGLAVVVIAAVTLGGTDGAAPASAARRAPDAKYAVPVVVPMTPASVKQRLKKQPPAQHSFPPVPPSVRARQEAYLKALAAMNAAQGGQTESARAALKRSMLGED